MTIISQSNIKKRAYIDDVLGDVSGDRYRKTSTTADPNSSSTLLIKNTWPIPTTTSYYLVFSSCLFLAPAVFAFRNNLMFYSVVGVITTIVSALYWADAEEFCLRRRLDQWFSKKFFNHDFLFNFVYEYLFIPP